ncbi:hypothetical protein AS026_37470 [Rhizobium altiplani]|uniref:Uncharacterized protein n=1 Tax=Rhizobium altiplani TaxID=1864509 RepID=A0A120FNP9_9HYPH|nr:hypothetical protein [Rhizobium altiplani]KWV55729.1 hypothetical protein AS026_37470 [Rhizobium altiplani]
MNETDDIMNGGISMMDIRDQWQAERFAEVAAMVKAPCEQRDPLALADLTPEYLENRRLYHQLLASWYSAQAGRLEWRRKANHA